MTILTKGTIYGSALQTALYTGAVHQIEENSTLNEKFDILTGASTPADENPTGKYICIGRGGHYNATGSDGASLTKFYSHQAWDAALYQHIPFVMRELDDDLTDVERQNYALRRIEEYNGVSYFCYYLRRVDSGTQTPQMDYRSGDNAPVEFHPSLENLNPTPVTVSSSGVNDTTNDKLSVTSIVAFNFDATDVEEIINACRIKYNDETYAVISEIGFCTGFDQNTTYTPDVGTQYTLAEAIGVQIATHITCMYPLQFATEGFEVSIDMGASEPVSVTNAL